METNEKPIKALEEALSIAAPFLEEAQKAQEQEEALGRPVNGFRLAIPPYWAMNVYWTGSLLAALVELGRGFLDFLKWFLGGLGLSFWTFDHIPEHEGPSTPEKGWESPELWEMAPEATEEPGPGPEDGEEEED